MSFLSIHKPHHLTAEGLFESLKYGLQCLGIQSVTKETCHSLVGLATDGAAANIAANGLKGLVERENCHGYSGCGAWHIVLSWQ